MSIQHFMGYGLGMQAAVPEVHTSSTIADAGSVAVGVMWRTWNSQES